MADQTKKKHNYINNEDFTLALIEYQTLLQNAKENKLPKPRIPNYIGECFLKIATGLAQRPNFYSYSYKDEMILDAVENCLMYFHNFDSTKYDKPFAYFTKIIWYAFLRRIEKEKKQQYVKYKAAENFGVLGEEELEDLDESILSQIQIYDNLYEFIEQFENTMKDKKIKISKQKGIEKFMDDFDE